MNQAQWAQWVTPEGYYIQDLFKLSGGSYHTPRTHMTTYVGLANKTWSSRKDDKSLTLGLHNILHNVN